MTFLGKSDHLREKKLNSLQTSVAQGYSLSVYLTLCLCLSHDLSMTGKISLVDSQKRKRKKSLEPACRHVIVHPGQGTRLRKAAIPCLPAKRL